MEIQFTNIIKHKQKKFKLETVQTASLDFAYPCNNYIGTIISNPFIKYTLRKFFDTSIKKEIETIISESSELTYKNSPRFYKIYEHCQKCLKIETRPRVYVSTRLLGINTVTIGTDSSPIILISPLTLIKLEDQQLSFMIGHELGHVAQGNLICHSVKGALDSMKKWSEVFGSPISELIETPLNHWYRCTEYTADRAGLICCGNLEHALSLFENIFPKDSMHSNSLTNYMEMDNDHPTNLNRIAELKKFHQEMLQN